MVSFSFFGAAYYLVKEKYVVKATETPLLYEVYKGIGPIIYLNRKGIIAFAKALCLIEEELEEQYYGY